MPALRIHCRRVTGVRAAVARRGKKKAAIDQME
jgi:hypothetical protein